MSWLAWLILVPVFFYASNQWDKQVAERNRREHERDDKLRQLEERVTCLERMEHRVAALERAGSSAPLYSRSLLDDD
jgi:hypothetical protein